MQRRQLVIDLDRVQPPHDVSTSTHHFQQILASMRDRGWDGRPLLVEPLVAGNYRAWTGSHRVAAARLLKLATVPCLTIDIEKQKKAGHRRVRCGPGLPWFGGKCELCDDLSYDCLVRAKDVRASRLMKLELVSNHEDFMYVPAMDQP